MTRALFAAALFAAALIAAPVAAQEASNEPQVTAELIARAEAGDMEAAEELGVAYMIAQDLDQAEAWTLRAAESGSAEAMNNMAGILRMRAGEPRPVPEADAWEQRAIAAGSSGAMLNRGATLVMQPDAASFQAGFALLQRAQHSNIGNVLDDLAFNYARNGGATRERARALTQLAAERGGGHAQWRYAMMLREGSGGPRDLPQAYRWARSAAETGVVDGMISTAVMLAVGEGVTPDPAQSRAWYMRAAQAGSAHALRGYGAMLLNAEGGQRDGARGWAYLQLARDGGDTLATRIMDYFRPTLTPAEEQASEQALTEWVAAHGRPSRP